MNSFLMVLGAFLALIGISTILTVVVFQIKASFEECNDEAGIMIIFLIFVGILGAVIFLLARNAAMTAAALDNVHYLFPEVT